MNPARWKLFSVLLACLSLTAIARTAAVRAAGPGSETPATTETAPPGEQDLARLEQLSNAMSVVAEQVRDSVVNIRAKVIDKSLSRRLQDIHGERMIIPATSTGSGIILDENGYIVTNNHVVSGAGVIWVTLAGGARYKARVVGVDPMTDLAVIQIKADGLRPARLGNSDSVRIGHIVLAIGSPFRLGHSVSHGIISALGRNEDSIDVDIDYKNWIQTDAPINPGNSGGPLLNVRGEVIGINVAIATESGGHQGVGFAIPSNTVLRVADALRRGKKVERGYLGVTIQPVDEDMASAYHLPARGGVMIERVFDESPAQQGSLKSEDIVLSINGKSVFNSNQLQDVIAATSPGTQVSMTIWRDRSEKSMRVTIGAQPTGFSTRQRFSGPAPDDDSDSQPEEPLLPQLEGPFAECGFEAQSITPEAIKKRKLDAGFENGVVVTNVSPISEAFEAGLRPNQVIIQANDEPVRNVRDLERALGPEALARGVRLRIQSNPEAPASQLVLRIR